MKNLNGQICQICGDTVGLTATGDVFVACNECAFPVCRPCYEYERKDGNQSCPQCKTRYKRHRGRFVSLFTCFFFLLQLQWCIVIEFWFERDDCGYCYLGSPRVEGDEDEDDSDDIENEFNYAQGKAKARRQWEDDPDLSSSSRRESQQPIPLLTNGQTVVIY